MVPDTHFSPVNVQFFSSNHWCINLVDEKIEGTTSLPLVRSNPEKPDPKSGALQLEWNLDGTFLITRFGRQSRLAFTYTYLKIALQKMHLRVFTSIHFLDQLSLLTLAFDQCYYTANQFFRHGGILSGREASFCVAERERFILGMHTGMMKERNMLN